MVPAWLVFALGAPIPAAGQTCPGPQPEVEPNGSPATATPLTRPTAQRVFLPVPGAISTPGDEDYFRFTAGKGSFVWLLVDTGLQPVPGASRDSLLDVYDENGTLLELDDNDGTAMDGYVVASGDASAIAALRIPATGAYFVRVRARNPADIMNYRLFLGLSSGFLPEREPNNTAQQANFAEPTVSAEIFPGDVDYYYANILDFGRPFVIVDGAPADPFNGVDITVVFETMTVGLHITANSSGDLFRPAEALLAPSIGMIRVTGTYFGPEPSRPYRIGVFYSGDTCQLPVQLQTFEVR